MITMIDIKLELKDLSFICPICDKNINAHIALSYVSFTCGTGILYNNFEHLENNLEYGLYFQDHTFYEQLRIRNTSYKIRRTSFTNNIFDEVMYEIYFNNAGKLDYIEFDDLKLDFLKLSKMTKEGFINKIKNIILMS